MTARIDGPADGGAAFPVSDSPPSRSGMSLRDYFAGHALAGLLAGSSFVIVDAKGSLMADLTAARAYAQADAMLAARKAP